MTTALLYTLRMAGDLLVYSAFAAFFAACLGGQPVPLLVLLPALFPAPHPADGLRGGFSAGPAAGAGMGGSGGVSARRFLFSVPGLEGGVPPFGGPAGGCFSPVLQGLSCLCHSPQPGLERPDHADGFAAFGCLGRSAANFSDADFWVFWSAALPCWARPSLLWERCILAWRFRF